MKKGLLLLRMKNQFKLIRFISLFVIFKFDVKSNFLVEINPFLPFLIKLSNIKTVT